MPIQPPITIHDIHQVDLDRHGLIEASAGTGKTYTIGSRGRCLQSTQTPKLLIKYINANVSTHSPFPIIHEAPLFRDKPIQTNKIINCIF